MGMGFTMREEVSKSNSADENILLIQRCDRVLSIACLMRKVFRYGTLLCVYLQACRKW
jgi:hypothetical protein